MFSCYKTFTSLQSTCSRGLGDLVRPSHFQGSHGGLHGARCKQYLRVFNEKLVKSLQSLPFCFPFFLICWQGYTRSNFTHPNPSQITRKPMKIQPFPPKKNFQTSTNLHLIPIVDTPGNVPRNGRNCGKEKDDQTFAEHNRNSASREHLSISCPVQARATTQRH